MLTTLPKAVLFDWDNTLVDTLPCIIAAMNITLRAMDKPEWTDYEARTRIAKSMRDTFPELFGDRWLEAKEIFQSSFRSLHLQMLQPLEGARSLLECLAGKGVYMAVVSNKTGEFLRTEADHLGWTSFFGCLVGAGDAARDKPEVEPVQMALQPLAGQGDWRSGTEDVWFVGDNPIDMHCGGLNGCLPILLHPQPPPAEAFGNYPPRLVLRDCAELETRLMTLAI